MLYEVTAAPFTDDLLAFQSLIFSGPLASPGVVHQAVIDWGKNWARNQFPNQPHEVTISVYRPLRIDATGRVVQTAAAHLIHQETVS